MLGKEAITFIVSNSDSLNAFEKKEKAGIDQIFSQAMPIVMIKNYLGECFASSPFLAIALLSKISSSSLFCHKYSDNCRNEIVRQKLSIQKGNIFILLAYNQAGNVAAVCLEV